jgi:hypothetical protein
MGTRVKALLVAAFAVPALAVAAGGCGGGGSETSSIVSAPTTGAEGPVSKSTFISQADAICAEANGAIRGLPTTAVGGGNAAEEAGIVRGELQSLRSLGNPASGGPEFSRYLAALDSLAAALDREKRATASTSAATAVDAARSTAQNAARAFGLRTCAGVARPSGTTATGGTGAGGTATTPVSPTTTTPVTPTTTTPTTPTPTPTPTPAPTPPPSSGGAGGGGTGTGGGGGGGGSGGVGVGSG